MNVAVGEPQPVKRQDVNELEPYPWLDEVLEDPLDAASQLCSACLIFFSRFQKHLRQTLRQLRLRQSLQHAAEAGCRLCTMILEEIKNRHHELDLPPELNLRFSPYVLNPGYRLDIRFDTFKDRSTKTLVGNTPSIAIVFERAFGDDKHFPSRLSTNTSSIQSRSRAIDWLSQCQELHQDCRQVSTTQSWLPSRLLQLAISAGTKIVQILPTDSLPPKITYIALSHCWGTKPIIRLTEANLEAFGQGFPLIELPYTFRHAFDIASWFGVEYLWIDSLCIIQDSLDDWQKEAITMKDVYKNAVLTIAATAASDSSVGCFFDRNATLHTGFNLTINKDSEEQADLMCFSNQLWSDAVSTAPLNQRAWVVQERLLSRRVLHMCRGQIAWECAELDACEACPEGLPKMLAELNRFKNAGSSRVMGKDAGYATFYGQWEYIVDAYSRSHLTRTTDKIIAFAGIAAAMAELYQEQYLAGLWRRNLAEQLMWRAVIVGNVGGEGFWRPSRCPYYRAPTWSWLSIDGPVDAGSAHGKPVLIEILDAQVENKDNALFTGHIKLRGVLTDATCETATSGSFRLRFEQEQWHGAYGELDDKGGQPPKQIKCLPIIQGIFAMDGDDVVYIEGLILVARKANKAEYERIGWFSADGQVCCERIAQGPFLQGLEDRRRLEAHDRRREDGAEEVALWRYLPTSVLTLV